MKPSTAAVLRLLRARGLAGVTPLDALNNVGTMRLAARISELRDAGYTITCDKSAGYGRYVLVEAEQLDWEAAFNLATGQ